MVKTTCADGGALERWESSRRRAQQLLAQAAPNPCCRRRRGLLSWTAVVLLCYSTSSWWLLGCDAAAQPTTGTALAAHFPTQPAPWSRSLGAQRGLLTDIAVHHVHLHVPSVSCKTEVPVTLLPNTTPPCCTASAADCAARCDSHYAALRGNTPNDRVIAPPACIAFKFARHDPSPPLAGASQCVLLVTASSCAVSLVPDPLNGVFQPAFPGTVVWDYYFRTYETPNTADRRYAQLNITGMPAASVAVPLELTNECLNSRCDHASVLGWAVQLAISQRCCATSVQATMISTVSANGTASTTSTWIVAIWPNWQADSSPFLATRLDAVLADPPGAAALLAAIQATFASVTAVSYEALNTTGLTSADSATHALASGNTTAVAADVQLWRSTAIGLAAALAAMLTLVVAHLARLLLHVQTPAAVSARGASADKGGATDVFLSYRHSDVALADAVFDQLSLAGLRVFFDRAGDMAGRPFEEELYRALRDAAVTSIVITLDGLRPCAHIHESRPDYWVAEVLLALHFSRQRPGHHVYPLLFGVPLHDGSGERRFLLHDADFRTVIDSLPDVVPTATLALASRLLAADAGGVLDDALQGITVRQLMLGRPATAAQTAPFRGLLSIGAVPIHGPEDHMGLVLRHRYAVQVMQAVGATQSGPERAKLSPAPAHAAEPPEFGADAAL